MNPPKLRIQLWWMMVAVGIVAVEAWLERTARLAEANRAIYSARAKFNESKEFDTQSHMTYRGPNGIFHRPAWTPYSEYHRRLKEKYMAAASHPLDPVEPDPPPPGWEYASRPWLSIGPDMLERTRPSLPPMPEPPRKELSPFDPSDPPRRFTPFQGPATDAPRRGVR